MNRSIASSRAAPVGQFWLAGTASLFAAVAVAVFLVEMMMAPPRDEIVALAAYLSLSGGVTLACGYAAVRASDRVAGLSIPVKAFLSAALGGAIALLNVLLIAQLMFVSKAHDLRLLLAIVAFSAVIMVFFNGWIARSISRRVETVASGIRELAARHYDSRIVVSGDDEVARLAVDVNALASRLQQTEQQREALDRERRDLTMAISHDLRTPLASMRAMVEALEDGVVTVPEEVSRYYGLLRRDGDRLSRMIDDLFELARLDAGALPLDRQLVDVAEIAAEVVNALTVRASRKSVELHLHADSPTRELALDGARIERALSNLVLNAIEHTPRGGRIDLHIGAAADGGIAVRVTDTGAGIAPEDLPRVWERFYRADRARTPDSDGAAGTGLGLAIVRGIVEAHGGGVRAASEPGRGATFEMWLPATAPAG